MRSLCCWAVLATLIAMTACGVEREPGPHADEYGMIAFWRTTGSGLTFEQCTDAQSWQTEVAPPSFPDNSYLIYQLSADGSQATAKECETTLPSSCSDSTTGIVFDVSGHDLMYDPVAQTRDINNSVCDMTADELWVITDRGETATLEVAIAFDLTGSTADCNALEAQIVSESSNGLGMVGCVATIAVDLEFDKVDD